MENITRYASEQYVDDKVNENAVVPSGGTTGQLLSKKSDTDNDVEWITPQVQLINPTSTEEFFNMTAESGLYYIPVTNTIIIESNSTSTTERLISGIEVNELISVYKTTEWGYNGELTNDPDEGNYYYLYNTNTLFLYSQENGISYINRLDDTISGIQQSIGEQLYSIYNEIDFKSSISNIKARTINDASIVIFDNIFADNVTYYTDPNYSDENNKIQGKYVININKTLDAIGINDKLSVVLQYQLNGGYDIYKFDTTVADTTGIICSKLISLSNNMVIIRIHADSKINSDFSIENNVNYCAIEIIFALNMSVDIIKEIKDSLKMYVELSSLNTLTLNNKEEYTPTDDYNPSTKKYVDDAIQNVSSGGIVNQLTDEELINALSEADYLIPINVFVNPSFTTSIYKEITIYDKDYNIIYSKEDFDSGYNNPASIDLFITQEIMNNGIIIFIKCFDGELLYIKMNDNDLIENTDYEYINDETDNINYIYITLTQVTGDIYMDIWGAPMPI